jgi:hypothetical protein
MSRKQESLPTVRERGSPPESLLNAGGGSRPEAHGQKSTRELFYQPPASCLLL